MPRRPTHTGRTISARSVRLSRTSVQATNRARAGPATSCRQRKRCPRKPDRADMRALDAPSALCVEWSSSIVMSAIGCVKERPATSARRAREKSSWLSAHGAAVETRRSRTAQRACGEAKRAAKGRARRDSPDKTRLGVLDERAPPVWCLFPPSPHACEPAGARALVSTLEDPRTRLPRGKRRTPRPIPPRSGARGGTRARRTTLGHASAQPWGSSPLSQKPNRLMRNQTQGSSSPPWARGSSRGARARSCQTS